MAQKAARQHPFLSAVFCGANPTTREGRTMLDTERAGVRLFSPRSSLAHPFPRGQLCRPKRGLKGQSCGPGAVISFLILTPQGLPITCKRCLRSQQWQRGAARASPQDFQPGNIPAQPSAGTTCWPRIQRLSCLESEKPRSCRRRHSETYLNVTEGVLL